MKSYIQNLETGFTKQLDDLSRTLEENEQKYSEDHKTTQDKIVAINEKVVETRQIIGGTSGGSKVNRIQTMYKQAKKDYKLRSNQA